MSLPRCAFVAVFTLSLFCLSDLGSCQSKSAADASKAADKVGSDDVKTDDANAVNTKKLVIPNEPKAVDPSRFVFAPLRKKVSVSFDGTSIREVIEWIKKELDVTVLVDESEFATARILLSDPVNDQLTNQPAYLLLDRLNSIQVGWYVEEGIIYLTSKSFADEHVMPTTINVGEFFDDDYSSDVLIELLQNSVDPQSWLDTNGGPGTLVLLGDVLFMQQTARARRIVEGLLAGLKEHGRQTFVGDSIEHISIREKLKERFSVNFDDKPLIDAIGELSKLGGVEIRMDRADFEADGIRDREPLTLSLSNQKLSTILTALSTKFKIDWTLEDGTVLLCSRENESEVLRGKIAIYDVRDLCRNLDESDALADAIMTQVNPDTWLETAGGSGTINFPKSGLMVIWQTERIHGIVLRQLEAYRQALKSSKIREQKDPGKEVKTIFYKMQTSIAMSLSLALKELVAPESWMSKENGDAIGTVRMLPSTPTVLEVKGKEPAVSLENSVLMIRQTNENHLKIAELIWNIENGNSKQGAGGGVGGGGLGGGGQGGGGFGGGLFSIQNRVDIRDE